MSLILDALNRSRQDSTPVPGLGTEHYLEPEQGRWQRYLPWSALLVALAVIVLLVLERSEPQPAAVLEPVREAPAAPATAPVAPVENVVVSPPPLPPAASMAETPVPAGEEQSAAEPEPVDPAVAELYRQAPERPAEQPAAEPAAEAGPGAVEPQSVVEPEEVAPAAGEQPVDIEKLVRQAQEEMENARLAEHSAPFVSELSQQTKNAIPTVYYQRHEYSGNPGQSTVVLNGKSLKVGGSPAAGMKVREILPDSVVLDYRGTEFRLRALNSWINL